MCVCVCVRACVLMCIGGWVGVIGIHVCILVVPGGLHGDKPVLRKL